MSAGIIGIVLLIVSIALMFVNLILGILMLIGSAWLTYKLFFAFVLESAVGEARERRAYVKRRRNLREQERKLLDSDIMVMDEAEASSVHLETCRCRLCC